MKGAWSLPGGALHLSERISEGVAREVREETGLIVRPIELVEVLDRISHDVSGRVLYHYVLLDWLCTTGPGAELNAGSDAAEAVWADMDALQPFGLEAETLEVIRRAADRGKELSL